MSALFHFIKYDHILTNIGTIWKENKRDCERELPPLLGELGDQSGGPSWIFYYIILQYFIVYTNDCWSKEVLNFICGNSCGLYEFTFIFNN